LRPPVVAGPEAYDVVREAVARVGASLRDGAPPQVRGGVPGGGMR